MACVSATGTLVFAIINLVSATLSTLGAIGLLIYFCADAFTAYTSSTSFDTIVVPASKMAGAIVFLVLSSVDLLFSSFLMNGILKKKPEHIKVYYIFGVSKVIMSLLLVFIAFKIDTQWLSYLHFYFIALVLHFMYVLILHMIRYTYLQFETTSKQFNHVPLNEKC